MAEPIISMGYERIAPFFGASNRKNGGRSSKMLMSESSEEEQGWDTAEQERSPGQNNSAAGRVLLPARCA
jgi:hypothetical protein